MSLYCSSSFPPPLSSFRNTPTCPTTSCTTPLAHPCQGEDVNNGVDYALIPSPDDVWWKAAKRNEQIIRSKLTNSRNRSSSQPYPGASSRSPKTYYFNNPRSSRREDEDLCGSQQFCRAEKEDDDENDFGDTLQLASQCCCSSDRDGSFDASAAPGEHISPRGCNFCSDCKNACVPFASHIVEFHADNPFLVEEQTDKIARRRRSRRTSLR